MKIDELLDEQYIREFEGHPVYVTGASHVTVNWHPHEFYELVFVREGFCMHHLGDSAFLAMEGDILFIKPGMRHKYTGTRECRIFNCLFTEDAFGQQDLDRLLQLPGMNRMLSQDAEPFPHLHLDMAERRQLLALLGEMEKECKSRLPGWRLKVSSMLCQLLVDCSRVYLSHGAISSEKDVYSGYVTRALRYIDEHYAEESLSVQSLGEYVGVSGDYLSRQFRKVTGIAVQEYIRRYRLSRALTCLQQGSSVGDAAKCSGFHSIGYFSREFKKEMGVPPSQYKQ